MKVENTGSRSWKINNGVIGLDFSVLPRCSGISKSTGEPCKRAAKKGQDFCGIHAGDYTPGTNKRVSPRLKHGIYTREAKFMMKEVITVTRAIYETIGTIKEEADYRDETLHGYDPAVRGSERQETCNRKIVKRGNIS